MQITVLLTLTIEVKDTEAAKQYLDISPDGSLSSDINPEFLADIFDDGIQDMIIYGEDKVLKLCGKTPEDIRHILGTRIP